MKVLFLVFVFISFSIVSFSQIEYPDSIAVTTVISDPDSVKTDKMELFNGTTLDVHIKKFSLTDIFYTLAKSDEMVSVERRLVKTITYKTGKIDIINTELKEKKPTKDFRKIKITKKKREVENMIDVGSVEATREGKSNEFVSVQQLERNALIELKKRAAQLNADYVLITQRKVNMGYGDVPQITLIGTAYQIK